jgi:NAD(P)-dependent dehydrogenase (short-subunit alcohol dehydrogenase family)
MTERIALVTGGSRGIGRAICSTLAQQGWQVVAVARDARALAAVAKEIADLGGRCDHFVCDARDPQQINDCVAQALLRYQRIDLLVNNAGGGSSGRPLPADELPDAEWVDTIDLNLTSAYRFCRAVAPAMKACGGGAIVNVSSIAAHVASNLSGIAYTAAKTGMVGLSRHLAKELGPFGIRVNTVAPGIIASERVAAKYEAFTEAERTNIVARIPLGRIGRVQEVAAVIAFLASDQASYIHGALIDINGGLFMD